MADSGAREPPALALAGRLLGATLASVLVGVLGASLRDRLDVAPGGGWGGLLVAAGMGGALGLVLAVLAAGPPRARAAGSPPAARGAAFLGAGAVLLGAVALVAGHGADYESFRGRMLAHLSRTGEGRSGRTETPEETLRAWETGITGNPDAIGFRAWIVYRARSAARRPWALQRLSPAHFQRNPLDAWLLASLLEVSLAGWAAAGAARGGMRLLGRRKAPGGGGGGGGVRGAEPPSAPAASPAPARAS